MGERTPSPGRSQQRPPVCCPAVNPAVSTASLVRSGDGHVVISWTTVGDCEKVDLAWGRSPDAVDHSHALTVEASAGRAIVGDLPAGRIYVSVAPSGGAGALVAAERNLGFAGVINFRDLGGYVGAGGQRVRWGRVFRSDALRFTDDDLETLGDVGLRTVYDLRSGEERETWPNRVPSGVTCVELPLISTDSDPDSPPRTYEDLITTADAEDFLGNLYLQLLESSAPTFGSIFSGLAEASSLPAVFHCAAGKDRTGMVAAILLSALGVHDEDIVDDYTLTSTYRRPEPDPETVAKMREMRKLTPEVVAGLIKTPRWAIESALAQLAARYGGADSYMTGPCGGDPGLPDRLRALLLEPA
jgi:protein-tyrosine phosphatase